LASGVVPTGQQRLPATWLVGQHPVANKVKPRKQRGPGGTIATHVRRLVAGSGICPNGQHTPVVVIWLLRQHWPLGNFV
jgi:hypothetical protein